MLTMEDLNKTPDEDLIAHYVKRNHKNQPKFKDAFEDVINTYVEYDDGSKEYYCPNLRQFDVKYLNYILAQFKDLNSKLINLGLQLRIDIVVTDFDKLFTEAETNEIAKNNNLERIPAAILNKLEFFIDNIFNDRLMSKITSSSHNSNV